MKTMKYINRMMASALAILSILSCSTRVDVDEEGLQTCTYRMRFDCTIDDDAFVMTKAGYQWEDGTVIQMQFQNKSSRIKGLATYSSATGEWVVTTDKTMSVVSDASCEAYWLKGLAGDQIADALTFGPEVAAFKDISATYTLDQNGYLLVTAHLSPMTSRVRFIGEPGRSFTVSGLQYISAYSRTSNSFTRVSLDVPVTIGPEGSSNYIYAVFAKPSERKLTISGDHGTAYVRTFPSEVLMAGTSGYMTAPTFEDLGKWTLVNSENSKEIFVPQVSETIVSNVKGSAATLQAQVIDDGNGKLLSSGFVYGTASSPTLETSASYSFEPIADFSVRIGGLDKTTTYYVRAYASNPRGLVYGPESSFTTTDDSDGINSDGYDDDDEEDWNTEGGVGEGDDVVKDDWSDESDWGSGEDSADGDEIGKDDWSDDYDWGNGEDSAEGDEIVKDGWPEDENWGAGEDASDDGSIGKDDWSENEDWNDEEWNEGDNL